MALDTS